MNGCRASRPNHLDTLRAIYSAFGTISKPVPNVPHRSSASDFRNHSRWCPINDQRRDTLPLAQRNKASPGKCARTARGFRPGTRGMAGISPLWDAVRSVSDRRRRGSAQDYPCEGEQETRREPEGMRIFAAARHRRATTSSPSGGPLGYSCKSDFRRAEGPGIPNFLRNRTRARP